MPDRFDFTNVHVHFGRHYDEIMRSDICGCFYCDRLFAPSEIKVWIEDGPEPADQTASCPYCAIDSVIGSASGYPITEPGFLKRLRNRNHGST